LKIHAIVLASNSIIEMTLQRVNEPEQGPGTTLVLDGQVQMPLHLGDRILVTTHGQHVRFVRNPASEYWSRLIGRLHWARAPRNRGA
jgi:NAD kinase